MLISEDVEVLVAPSTGATQAKAWVGIDLGSVGHLAVWGAYTPATGLILGAQFSVVRKVPAFTKEREKLRKGYKATGRESLSKLVGASVMQSIQAELASLKISFNAVRGTTTVSEGDPDPAESGPTVKSPEPIVWATTKSDKPWCF